MDFSVILILPYSALVTIATLVGALLLKRDKPRLIWPCAFAIFTAAPVLVEIPRFFEFGPWLALFLNLSIWAAIGAVMGRAIFKLFTTFRARISD